VSLLLLLCHIQCLIACVFVRTAQMPQYHHYKVQACLPLFRYQPCLVFSVLMLLLPCVCFHMFAARRQQFSPVLRYFLWIMAEIAIIGSDIQEVRYSSRSSSSSSILTRCCRSTTAGMYARQPN
jgi:hypothetical protein